MRSLLAVALLLLALAGCGGSDAGAPLGEAAELAPASAAFYAAVRTDGDDDQWQTALALVERFPGTGELLAELRELEPALGDEVVLVGLEEKVAVALLRPEDADALRERLREREGDHVTRERDGWTLVAEEEAHLDRYEQELERGTLAADADFRAALDGLPEDGLAHGFVRSDEGDGPAWAGAAAVAEDDGLRLEGRVEPREDAAEPFASTLLDRAPEDSLAFVTFSGREGGTALARLPQGARDAVEQLTGLRLAELEPLLEGEGAILVRGGFPIPELTLLLRVEDEEEALRQLEPLLERRGTMLRFRASAADGVLALTTGSGDPEPPAEGERLSDSEAFRAAREAAGMPDETTGFTYVDVERALPLVEQLGALLGGGDDLRELRERLAPLRSLLLFGGEDGRVGGFATIR